MSERPSSNRGDLLQVATAGVLAAALGVSYCSHRSEEHSDDLPEPGDTTSPDSPEAAGSDEPTSPHLLTKLANRVAGLSAETAGIEAERDFYRRGANLAATPEESE